MKIKIDFTFKLIKNKKNKNHIEGFRLGFNKHDIELRKKKYPNEGELPPLEWSNKRGEIYKNKLFILPLDYCLSYYNFHTSYAEAVGYKNADIDWVLDEFDASFNKLAISSMKYHMDYAVTGCNDKRREYYENMIKRLTYKSYKITNEELDAIEGVNKLFLEDLNNDNFDSFFNPERTPEQQEIYEQYLVNRENFENSQSERIKAARLEFVEKILPGLWS